MAAGKEMEASALDSDGALHGAGRQGTETQKKAELECRKRALEGDRNSSTRKGCCVDLEAT